MGKDNIAKELADEARESKRVFQRLIKTEKGYPVQCVTNVIRVLELHDKFKGIIKLDNWTGKLSFRKGDKWEDFIDAHYIDIQKMFQQEFDYFAKVPKSMIIDAVDAYAQSVATDSAVSYLRSLKWDGVSRLSTFIHNVYGTPDDEYHSRVGENFLKGTVARVVRPGVKFDTVLCIRGKQGIGKTISLLKLAGDMGCLETMGDIDSKDFLLQMRGNLIIELAEGVSISRKKDFANLKGFISRQEDVYREPYGRLTRIFPRRCVFAMTYNNEEFSKDTENRRFIPIHALKGDFEYIEENRDQLFAEALHRIEVLHEKFYEYTDDLEEKQQETRIESPYHSVIVDWLANEGDAMSRIDWDEGFTVMEVWQRCLSGDMTHLKKWDEMEIADTLKVLGYERRRVRQDGTQKWRWYKCED